MKKYQLDIIIKMGLATVFMVVCCHLFPGLEYLIGTVIATVMVAALLLVLYHLIRSTWKKCRKFLAILLLIFSTSGVYSQTITSVTEENKVELSGYFGANIYNSESGEHFYDSSLGVKRIRTQNKYGILLLRGEDILPLMVDYDQLEMVYSPKYSTETFKVLVHKVIYVVNINDETITVEFHDPHYKGHMKFLIKKE